MDGGIPTYAFLAVDSKETRLFATSLHTHSVSDASTDSSTTGITLYTSAAVTGIPGSTGSAGGHSHSVSAPVLAIDFDYLAIEA
jgi:hypothetical protein